MKSFILQIKSGWHHGKGGKYTRKGNFESALKHFQAALKYAQLGGDIGGVPLEMECIALTFVRLGNYEQAQKYAEESYNLYNKLQESNSFFLERVKKVVELLRIIEKRGTI